MGFVVAKPIGHSNSFITMDGYGKDYDVGVSSLAIETRDCLIREYERIYGDYHLF